MKTAQKRSPLSNQFPTLDTLFNAIFDDNVTNKRIEKSPPVNIIELEDAFRLDLAAPGLDKNLFNIEVDKDQLKISYIVDSNETEKKENFKIKEFNYSSFTRSFYIPEMINTDTIDAVYADGILTVKLNKKEDAKDKGIKKVEIK